MYDLIVIGAGPGGYEAAAHAGALGKKTVLIEEKQLGGICLNAGCIPTKTLLHSAKVLEECRGAGLYGVTCPEPHADFAAMQARKVQVVAQLVKGVGATLKRSKVEIIEGRARLLAGRKVAVNGDVLEAQHILLATGSRPACPPIPGLESPGVLDSTALLQLDSIPASLVIIGAGAIGLEFACLFARLGSRVTVIEMLAAIAPQLDREIAGFLQQNLEKQGIRFVLGSRVTEIRAPQVRYTTSEGRSADCEGEIILNATGRRPNVEALGLEECSVLTAPGGICTDERGRTNVAGIWACGDVTGRCLLAHAATREGIVAVNNMFGVSDVMNYRAIPSVVYTQPEAAGVGVSEEALKAAGIAYRTKTLPMSISGRFVAEQAEGQGYVKVLVGETYREILGVHILGGPAGEMIYGAAALLEAELTAPDTSRIVFPHPTISEAIKAALNLLC